MRFPYLLAAALLPALASAQPAPGFQRLPSGTAYKLFRRNAAGQYQLHTVTPADVAGYKNRVGKALLVHMEYRTGKDSVLQSTRKTLRNHPVPVPLQPVAKRGGQEEALSLLQPGDSAVFRFSTTALFPGGTVPAELKRGGNTLTMRVAAVKLISAAEATRVQQQLQTLLTQQQQQQAPAQLKKDDAVIQAYLKAKHLPAAKKTAGGVYYFITRPSNGPVPLAGQTVAVQYTGTLLSGKEFDSSARHGGQPIEFVVGRGQVIPGWDQALLVLPKGCKATLLIPSTLAYGARSAGADVPANSPLRFDIELTNIK